MKINDHVIYRFVQRVIGIKSDKEVQRYIARNRFEIVYKILEFINKSEILIENYAPGRRDTLDYYVNGETLILTKPKKTELVTLYDIRLDANSKTNSNKIRQYVSTIKVNNHKIRSLKLAQDKQNPITKHLEYMLDYFDGELSDGQISRINKDIKESIEICKQLALEEKTLRLENREMMSEMFKKLSKDQ